MRKVMAGLGRHRAAGRLTAPHPTGDTVGCQPARGSCVSIAPSGKALTLRLLLAPLLLALLAPPVSHAQRAAVLKQIDVPHNYYFREMYLPQLTSGPSAVAFSPDGRALVYSMQGSLWKQSLDSTTAEQLTSGPGYDFQPDWSPDGTRIAFVRYDGDAMELAQLNVATGAVSTLTNNHAVNTEPRWSPDGQQLAWVSTAGTGHFHVFAGRIDATAAADVNALKGAAVWPERRSRATRYYYSQFDHELSPTWSSDGKELIYVGNPESLYGTGGLWRRALSAAAEPILIRSEETTWRARPSWSPDGKRVIYSSYAGRQWHQLWVTTAAGGGDPLPVTFGDFDATGARWSPDGLRVAYISNQSGGTEIWVRDVVGGAQRKLEIRDRHYRQPMGQLTVQTLDADGRPAPARVAIVAADGRSYAPDDAWVHADDGFDRRRAKFETHYFHTVGEAHITLPVGAASITVWRGMETQIERRTVEVGAAASVSATALAGATPQLGTTTQAGAAPPAGATAQAGAAPSVGATAQAGAAPPVGATAQTLQIKLQPLSLPADWSQTWQSADVHVHMNYGGTYRNTPERLVQQSAAEDLDVVFNLVVNKEQRIPDIAYFSTKPDAATTPVVLLSHGQEHHTSYWGHLGLLGLNDHFLIPDFSGYANTAAASLYPTNGAIADLAHAQNALVGYVHPFDEPPDPASKAPLTNALPIDVALGKVDYYEVLGFSEHRTSADVWYRLLNCGFRPAAAAGTDAMANFASLRGPVGMNRVYALTGTTTASATERTARWLAALRAGHTMATNGPLLGLTVEGEPPGSEITLTREETQLRFKGFLRSIVPIDHLEIVTAENVVLPIKMSRTRTSADFEGKVTVSGNGWILVRAWNDGATPEILDLYPYATTNAVLYKTPNTATHCGKDADYFVAWLDRLKDAASKHEGYNTSLEREATLREIRAARAVMESRR